MKNILFILFLLVGAQSYSQCFSIETVLADACGNPEGENEMVVLRIDQSIDIANLDVDWPNNSFLGWCTNPAKTILLNNTISSSCGLLLEPVLGIVPANSKLLIVTSTNMLVNANSFDGLTDTLYIVYQCAGNTSGHFSNSASSLRYLTVNYNGTCVQSETVSYLGSSLPGSDGGAIFYDLNGNETYYNTGCNAPVPTMRPNWSFPSEICNTYGLLDLKDFLSPNTTQGGSWSGDIENLHFFNTINKLGTYSITYTVNDPNSCLQSTDSTIMIEVVEAEYEYDTIVVCDSIEYRNYWYTKDSTIYLPVNIGNEYLCDITIVRTYDIETAGFTLLDNDVSLESGASFDFEILGNDPFQYSFSNFEYDSCSFPCIGKTIYPTDHSVYYVDVINEINKCKNTIKLNVTINYQSVLDIPNIFTPNNDGENDVFKLYGSDIERIKFNIYSKWGELLFTGNKLTDYWDGTYNSKPLENGNYVLQIEAAGKDGKQYKEVVNISLVR